MNEEKTSRIRWGVQWRSKNLTCGEVKHFMRDPNNGDVVLFATRKESEAYIHDRYKYMANRKDLRREPHGWRMPVAVKVKVTVKIVEP